MSFRWGILGAGDVALKFALDLKHAGAEPSVVASRTASRAEALARKASIPEVVTDVAGLVAAGVDAIYIATPPSSHAPLALQCIEAGVPLIVEKPFAPDAAAARAVVEQSRRRGVFCMEGMWTRFLPAVRELNARVSRGDVGDVRLVTGSFCSATAVDPTASLYTPEFGGGALLHRGVYPLSLASHLMGAPIDVTSSARLGATGVDEDVALTVVHANGGISITYSSLRTASANDLTVMGTRGTIHLRAPIYRPFELTWSPVTEKRRPTSGRFEVAKEGALLQRLNQILSGPRETWAARRQSVSRAPYHGNGYHYEAMELMSCVKTGKRESEIMPLADTIAILETVDRARAQWR